MFDWEDDHDTCQYLDGHCICPGMETGGYCCEPNCPRVRAEVKQCPFCDGSGIVSGYTHDYGDESCTCPVCEGDGKINAMTIIRRIVESPPALRQYRR